MFAWGFNSMSCFNFYSFLKLFIQVGFILWFYYQIGLVIGLNTAVYRQRTLCRHRIYWDLSVGVQSINAGGIHSSFTPLQKGGGGRFSRHYGIRGWQWKFRNKGGEGGELQYLHLKVKLESPGCMQVAMLSDILIHGPGDVGLWFKGPKTRMSCTLYSIIILP